MPVDTEKARAESATGARNMNAKRERERQEAYGGCRRRRRSSGEIVDHVARTPQVSLSVAAAAAVDCSKDASACPSNNKKKSEAVQVDLFSWRE